MHPAQPVLSFGLFFSNSLNFGVLKNSSFQLSIDKIEIMVKDGVLGLTALEQYALSLQVLPSPAE